MPAASLDDLVRTIRRQRLGRPRRSEQAGLAVALVKAGSIETFLDPGADPIDDDILFEIGSITKTITATLLATLVVEGRLRLDSTVGDVLGAATGGAAALTMVQLATHTAGLPRLAPNARDGADESDPYAHYGVQQLLAALADLDLTKASSKQKYSNFGYQLLGHVLAVAAGEPYERLVIDRVLLPAGCVRPRCGAEEPGDRRVPGYSKKGQTPRWRQQLGGAGMVELGITDLARWVRANLDPDSTPLVDAVRLAHRPQHGDRRKGIGLGWHLMNGGLWHNGGTGGFHSFCAFVPGYAGNAVLANRGGWKSIDFAAVGHLNKVIKAKT